MGYDIRELIIRSSLPSRDVQMEVFQEVGKNSKRKRHIFYGRTRERKKMHLLINNNRVSYFLGSSLPIFETYARITTKRRATFIADAIVA